MPALQRLVEARPEAAWHYWGPRERLLLLPGWRQAPPQLLRAGHSLWGGRPDPEAARWLSGASTVVAFAADPPPWLPAGPRGIHLRSFPTGGDSHAAWVPQYQARQLAAVGVPRPPSAWLPRWREQVLPVRSAGRLLLHPGSGDRAKDLPVSTWRVVVADLSRELGCPPRILLGPVEQERGPALSGWSAEQCTCSSLGELLAELAGAALLLGNDSGVTHLAAALGIPTVAVFGPSDPRIWRPLGGRVSVVSSGRVCSPCCSGPPVTCTHLACLTELPAASIVAAARRLVATAPHSD